MNTYFTTPAETTSLLRWFDSIWNNPDTTRDIKVFVLAQLEDIFVTKSPELVYFLTLYNVFRDFLGELKEDEIMKTRTGIKNTLIWNKLYKFQRDGVLGSIDKIEKYNGCIIADSVGLGKTFEALAIIKYYELRNDRVLVLCPKKIRENLAAWAQDELDIHSALVTGTGSNKTTMPRLRKDLATIITSFSPLSKERAKIDESLTEEIDILISTDCLSEGQNLQDCDYVVNYDIHWNPVRIIQRFGRIDRLGSANEIIQLVNFWPNMELDEYINLEARVSGRMVLLDISATGEENIIEFANAGKMNDLEYRRRQLEQLQNEVVDIEDLGGGISITDLTLNDFRMDLTGYLENHADKLEQMHLGALAVVRPDDLINDEISPGVFFCLRSENAKTKIDSTYALVPYYLVYVADTGEVLLNFPQAKKILDLLKKLSLGRSHPDMEAVKRFNTITRNATDMNHYQNLLAKAVAAITGKAEEKGVESLFHRGGTALTKESFQGMDDFEVVSYLIIAGADKEG